MRGELLRQRVFEWVEGRPASVLDVGCATGELAIEFAARGASVTAVDRSPDLLAEAESVVEADARHQVQSRVADLNQGLAENIDEFDLVICHNVIGYALDPSAAVQAVAGRVGPGGLLSLSFANAASEPVRVAVGTHDLDGALRIARGQVDRRAAPCGDALPLWRDAIEGTIAAAGLRVVRRAGVLVVNNLLPNHLKLGEGYDKIYELERALGERVDQIDSGAIVHLLARR